MQFHSSTVLVPRQRLVKLTDGNHKNDSKECSESCLRRHLCLCWDPPGAQSPLCSFQNRGQEEETVTGALRTGAEGPSVPLTVPASHDTGVNLQQSKASLFGDAEPTARTTGSICLSAEPVSEHWYSRHEVRPCDTELVPAGGFQSTVTPFRSL